MPISRSYDAQDVDNSDQHEQSSFLSNEDRENETVVPKRPTHARQPSINYPGTPRTPRTSNRVRFNLEGTTNIPNIPNGNADGEAEEWLDDEDYLPRGRRSSTGQRAPLLTGIEAPSVTTALEIEVEDLLENARPKSAMSSAFMNMANSIIGAGIIGTLID